MENHILGTRKRICIDKHDILKKLFLTPSFRNNPLGTSLEVQWLRLLTFSTEGEGLIPRWESKIPRAMWRGQKKKPRIKTTLCISSGHHNQIPQNGRLLFLTFVEAGV